MQFFNKFFSLFQQKFSSKFGSFIKWVEKKLKKVDFHIFSPQKDNSLICLKYFLSKEAVHFGLNVVNDGGHSFWHGHSGFVQLQTLIHTDLFSQNAFGMVRSSLKIK